MNEKICTVKVQEDHIKKITSASPEHALAELIWNALDADASIVNVIAGTDALGQIKSITVRDNGTAFSINEAEMFFSNLGGSWKSAKSKSAKGRFLHGKEGQGRFKAFALGQSVEWHVNYKIKDTGGSNLFIIYSYLENLQSFKISEVLGNDAKAPGVVVHVYDLNKQFKIFKSGEIVDKLLPIFCLYLKNYPEVKISVLGQEVDMGKAVRYSKKIDLNNVSYKENEYSVILELIEWSDLDVKELWYCDDAGRPLCKYGKQIRGVGDFSFSGYLKSAYFNELNTENLIDLDDFNNELHDISEEAVKKIKEHFLARALEEGQEQIRKWKKDDVYPYKEEAATPIEVAERQIFDIVAVKINNNLPSQDLVDKKGKAFQLRMLRQVVESSPDDLRHIINEVLNLPAKSREELSELLQDITLTGIINASKLVADRLKFITGLEFILFDDQGKKNLKERSQLHRILAENSWFFGPEFSVSVDDQSLTAVLKKHREILGVDVEINDSVKRIDGSVGIIDLMLSRSLPCSREDEVEHLVVELKAPDVKVGSKECSQIESYAFAIAADERFSSLKARWSFWVISNDMDDTAKFKTRQDRRAPGILYKSDDNNVTIWVKTWSQIIKENKYRLKFVQDKLNYDVDKSEGIQYLRKVYSEFLKGVVVDNEEIISAEEDIGG